MNRFIIIVSFGIALLSLFYYQVTETIPTRRDPDQAPKSRFGLVPVGAESLPVQAGGVDIIFVHGLGSNPDTTWRTEAAATQSDSAVQYVNWVDDFLLHDLPPAISRDVRMFYYNYDSYWERDAVSTRLNNLGNDLLEHLGKIRASEEERSRDLVFVGHCYGGLVVKKALLRSTEVTNSTQAIFFLGTPHRGSSLGWLGWLKAHFLLPRGSNPSILANLEYDSLDLLDLQGEFLAAIPDQLRVFNFFEQRPVFYYPYKQFVVSEQSATYGAPPKVQNIGLPVDHYGLNKFESRNESYQRLLSKLIEVTKYSARPLKRRYSVPSETVQTYIQRDELSKRLEDMLHIQHEKAGVPHAVAIHGLGGSGKSQLALKYAESNRDRYDPILWIDAADERTMRSSFIRCATELGLPDDRRDKRETTFVDNGAVQSVLRWLHDRTGADDEWLVIIDNADDLSLGIKKIIPKGVRGSVIITSQDERSPLLVPGGCEQVRVDVMSPSEGTTLLLQHLDLDIGSASREIRKRCNNVAQKLGYLALAIDLAGAYISNDPVPEQALVQYLTDYEVHRDELLQMDGFRGLLPTEKTVWTVWDTTLQKIMRDHGSLPGLLLTFLAHFKGTIIQDEMFRLAALGTTVIDTELADEISTQLQKFLPVNEGKWDSFSYRQSRDLLVRYNLLRRVGGVWPGVTMHTLVQWRAIRSEQSRPWQWWYIVFAAAACRQLLEERQPEFRRHLVVHLPDICGVCGEQGRDMEKHGLSMKKTLGRVLFQEGLLQEAEKLQVQVVKTCQTELGACHPDTMMGVIDLVSTLYLQGRYEEAASLQKQLLDSCETKFGECHPHTVVCMTRLASTFFQQGYYEKAASLQKQLLEIFTVKLGGDHPDTLACMANLASTYKYLGRWKDAIAIEMMVTDTFNATFGDDDPSTLRCMGNLALTYRYEGRHEDAERLQVQVAESFKNQLGADHPTTLMSMDNLALTYRHQGRWDEAEKLQVQVMEMSEIKLGPDHLETLMAMEALAFTYYERGHWKGAEKLFMQVTETRRVKLGADHLDTLASMKNLAAAYGKQGRQDEAEELRLQVSEKLRVQATETR